ncbi:phosphotransferase [Celeribacter indicus]|nr:phosphotransferase [Celeribacter indicus]SDW31821.1 Phosphotransferase enzyme family protein [Celeribacter indicus]
MAGTLDLFGLDSARARLDKMFAERPHLSSRATDVRIVQARGERAVFRLCWDGRPAMAKLIWHGKAAQAVSGQAGALREMCAFLGRGPAQVPEVLHVAPGDGFFVISAVPGQSAETLLTRGGEAEVPRAADAARLWLSRAAGLRRDTVPFPRAWLHRQLDALSHGDAADVAARTRQLLHEAPQSLTRHAGHGDFWPGNLMIDAEAITAIDLAGRRDIPLAEDIARFAHGLMGHSGDDLVERVAAPLLSLLSGEEAAQVFPVFHGLHLARTIHGTGGLRHLHERARFLGL